MIAVIILLRVLAGRPRPHFQRPPFAHEQPVHRPSIFSPISEKKNKATSVCRLHTSRLKVLLISNTVAGKVFHFRFCLLKIYTAGPFLVPRNSFVLC